MIQYVQYKYELCVSGRVSGWMGMHYLPYVMAYGTGGRRGGDGSGG